MLVAKVYKISFGLLLNLAPSLASVLTFLLGCRTDVNVFDLNNDLQAVSICEDKVSSTFVRLAFNRPL